MSSDCWPELPNHRAAHLNYKAGSRWEKSSYQTGFFEDRHHAFPCHLVEICRLKTYGDVQPCTTTQMHVQQGCHTCLFCLCDPEDRVSTILGTSVHKRTQ